MKIRMRMIWAAISGALVYSGLQLIQIGQASMLSYGLIAGGILLFYYILK